LNSEPSFARCRPSKQLFGTINVKNTSGCRQMLRSISIDFIPSYTQRTVIGLVWRLNRQCLDANRTIFNTAPWHPTAGRDGYEQRAKRTMTPKVTQPALMV